MVVAAAAPKIERLVMRELGMPPSDAEDCVGEALEAFYARENELETTNPYAYLTTSALNAARTLYRRQKREREEQLSAIGCAAPTLILPREWAVVAVEEMLGDVEADESWAVDVVALAMEKLGPRQRQVVAYLAAQEYDYSREGLVSHSPSAAAVLGMNAAAFRKAKERAFEKLRVEIPAAVEQLGIAPPPRFVGVFEEQRGKFLGEENGD